MSASASKRPNVCWRWSIHQRMAAIEALHERVVNLETELADLKSTSAGS